MHRSIKKSREAMKPILSQLDTKVTPNEDDRRNEFEKWLESALNEDGDILDELARRDSKGK